MIVGRCSVRARYFASLSRWRASARWGSPMSRVMTTAPAPFGIGATVRATDSSSAVLVAVDRAGDVEALPELRGGCGTHGLLVLVRHEQRDRLADGLLGVVAVDRLRAGAPADDRPVEVNADYRLGCRVAHGVELLGDEPALLCGALPARGEPAGESADEQPGWEADQRAQRLVGDEEEVERPACARDREPAPDAPQGARNCRDQEPGGYGDSRVVVVPVTGQADERLQNHAGGDGERKARAGREADGGPL